DVSGPVPRSRSPSLCPLPYTPLFRSPRRQGPLIPPRGRGIADRARPVAGITHDGVLVGTGVGSHPDVLGGGSARRTIRAGVDMAIGTGDQEGPVPAATDPERLVQTVHLLPGTLHPLPGRLGITPGLAELLPGRLGSGAPVGEAHPLAGCCEHLLIALVPGSASTLAVADSPVQRIDVPTYACTCLTQLGSRGCGVLVEVDRVRGAHIE